MVKNTDNIEVIKTYPKKGTEEIYNTAQSIRYFLSKVHPSLVDGTDSAACVCIMPIQRGITKNKKYNFNLNKPLCIWKWEEKTEKMLINFLGNLNGETVDLYYGVYNFNYQKETQTKEGKQACKGHVNNQNARYTKELFLDFDNCSEEQFKNYTDMLKSVGIEGLGVFTGHGYQLHILLSEPSWKDQNALLKLVYLCKAKGLDVDINCIDPARKSRLPQWTNFKCLDQAKYAKEINNPPRTKGVCNTDKRYKVAEVLSRIDKLPTQNPESLEEYNKIINLGDTVSLKKAEKKEVEYKYICPSSYPAAVEKMLTTTCKCGFRNNTLGFLVKYFKSYDRMDKEQFKTDINLWHNNIVEGLIDNFNKEVDRLWNMGGLCYNADLQKQYGYIDFNNLFKVKKDRDINIPNTLIDCLVGIDKGAIKVYLVIKMVEHLEMECSIKNIVDLAGLSRRSVLYGLDILIKKRHVYKTKTNRRNKEIYLYNTQKIVDINKGYTVLTYNDIKCITEELKNNSVKLYLYMLRKCYKNKFCTLNQKELAEAIAVNRASIPRIIQNLEDKKYITINKLEIRKNIYSNSYVLKR